jgi:hypothetical protein
MTTVCLLPPVRWPEAGHTLQAFSHGGATLVEAFPAKAPGLGGEHPGYLHRYRGICTASGGLNRPGRLRLQQETTEVAAEPVSVAGAHCSSRCRVTL